MATFSTALALASVLGASQARADYFDGAAESSYHQTGLFSITSPTTGTALLTHAGWFRVESAAGEYDWLFAVDPPVDGLSGPWASVEYLNWGRPFLTRPAAPDIAPTEISLGISGGYILSLGRYERKYIASIYLDGVAAAVDGVLSYAGEWTFDSVLWEERGRRPDAVPEIGSMNAIFAATLLGLFSAKRLSKL